MLLAQVALVAENIPEIPAAELNRVAAALQKQVSRDFTPVWGMKSTVDAFAHLEDVPLGYWPIIVLKDIHDPGAGGFHTDKNGQPFALVQYSNSWSLTASHECLEMFADSFGNRLIAGQSPKPDQGRVEFLVEVCDPCERADFAYTVNGVLVSDFYTPRYFDPVAAPGVPYSFTGSITKPRDVLPGGYLSWHEPITNHWWQLRYFGTQPEFADLGIIDQKAGSIREIIDSMTPHIELEKGLAPNNQHLVAAIAQEESAHKAKVARADALRQQIKALAGGS
jgi:hypothetical protein